MNYYTNNLKLAANTLNQWSTVYFAVSRSSLKKDWRTVCKLNINATKDCYSFCYTCGAFNGIPWFLEEYPILSKTYTFKELPEIFSRQLPNMKMFSHEQIVRWFGLPSYDSPIKILSLMGINQSSTQYQIIPEIILNKFNQFSHIFFLQNLLPNHDETIRQLHINEQLHLDFVKQQDISRIRVLTSQNVFLGYLPWYLTNPLSDILAIDSHNLLLCVHGINLDAPPQFRLRCYVQGQIPLGFNIQFCESQEFIPINQMPTEMTPRIVVR